MIIITLDWTSLCHNLSKLFVLFPFSSIPCPPDNQSAPPLILSLWLSTMSATSSSTSSTSSSSSSSSVHQTINAHHRPLGPTYSLPARRALPRIPEVTRILFCPTILSLRIPEQMNSHLFKHHFLWEFLRRWIFICPGIPELSSYFSKQRLIPASKDSTAISICKIEKMQSVEGKLKWKENFQEEEKSCLGSTNGSLGVSSTCWREEERKCSTFREEKWSRLRGKVSGEKSARQNRATTLLKWENPYWSSSNSPLWTINNQDTSTSTCHPQTKR